MKKLILKYPLACILVLTIILRLPLLNGSFWLDEAAQALEIIRPFNQQLDIISDFQPPLLHLILHFAQYFSRSEWFLRTIGAVIPGIITIIFTYKIAVKLFSKQVAFLSTLLLATSSFHIFYSQELRPYSLPTALAVLSMYYLTESLEQKNSKDSIVFLTIFNTLGLYASYLYPFFLLAQIAYTFLALKIKKTKKLFISFGVTIATFFPFLPIFLQQLAEGGVVRKQLPGWEQVVSVIQLKAIPLVFGKLLFGVLPLDASVLVIVLAVALTAALLLIAPHILKNLKKYNFKLLFFWIIVPLITAWLISFVVPVIQPKRLLFLLPGIYILIAHIADILMNSKSRKVAIFFVSTFLTINLLGTTAYYATPNLQRENWRELVTRMHREFVPSETLLVYSFPEEFAPMRWYVHSFPTFSTKTLYIENVPNLTNDLKVAASYKTILVFDYLRDLTDPNNKIESVLLELGFRQVGVLDYPNIGFVRVFMQPLNVIGMK